MGWTVLRKAASGEILAGGRDVIATPADTDELLKAFRAALVSYVGFCR